VECKLTERPGSQDLRGLKRLAAFYGAEAIAHAYIVFTTRQPFDPAPGITAINGWTAWVDQPAGLLRKTVLLAHENTHVPIHEPIKPISKRSSTVMTRNKNRFLNIIGSWLHEKIR
jgi:hypothetical protein